MLQLLLSFITWPLMLWGLLALFGAWGLVIAAAMVLWWLVH